ncbi:MAG: hypothetical protein ABW219_06690 [Ilumatobacteraceae bacterium]
MWAVLITVLAVAACIGMLVIAIRIEPHWVAKDQRRFLTTSEQVDPLGTVIGRRKEVKGLIADDGRIVLRHRALMRSTRVVYAIQSKLPQPPAGKVLYLLRPIPAAVDGSLIVLRVPASSELVSLLDALGTDDDAPAEGELSAPPPDP